MHDKSHHIERLAVHLKDHQHVKFADGAAREALEQASKAHTTLTAWFALNRGEHVSVEVCEHARGLTYAEVPEHFTWNKQKHGGCWLPRKSRSAQERVI